MARLRSAKIFTKIWLTDKEQAWLIREEEAGSKKSTFEILLLLIEKLFLRNTKQIFFLFMVFFLLLRIFWMPPLRIYKFWVFKLFSGVYQECGGVFFFFFDDFIDAILLVVFVFQRKKKIFASHLLHPLICPFCCIDF